MRELVLDASVVVKWFDPSPAPRVAQARILLAEFENGELLPVVPSLLCVEVLNVAGRSWQARKDELLTLAQRLGEMQFAVLEPEQTTVANWIAEGLTAYDAVYVSLAEERGLRLLTDDKQILAVAQDLTLALGS